MRRRSAMGSRSAAGRAGARASPGGRGVSPLPLSPTSASVSPAATAKLTSASARVPSGQVFPTSTTSSAATRTSSGAGTRVVYPQPAIGLQQLTADLDTRAQGAVDRAVIGDLRQADTLGLGERSQQLQLAIDALDPGVALDAVLAVDLVVARVPQAHTG